MGRIRIVLFILLFSTAASSALAQRTLPGEAVLGRVEGFEYPHAKIGGTLYRLAPGAKIFDQWNRIVIPPSLPSDTPVLYLLDAQGDLARVWVLTPDELEREASQRRR